jgi:DNA end-binding protein Ku
MGKRATWAGTLGFGLVSIPVKLYKGNEDPTVKFNQLHKECGGKIELPKRCSKCGKIDLVQEDIIKGYPLDKDEWLQMTDADFENLPIGDKDTIQIVEFVDPKEVDPRYIKNDFYYATPDKGGAKAFALLFTGIVSEGKAAIAKYTLRDKQHLVLIRPLNDILLVQPLKYSTELRDATEYSEGLADTKEDELKIAKQLISKLTKKAELKNFHDEYTEALKERIEAKLAGGVVKIQPQAAAIKEVGLLDALVASVKAAEPVAA